MRRESLNAAKTIIVRLCCIALLSMLVVAEWPGAGGDARAAAGSGEESALASGRDGVNGIRARNASSSSPQPIIHNQANDDTACGPLQDEDDTDGDGVPNSRDNCPCTYNPEKIAYITLTSLYEPAPNGLYLADADGGNSVLLDGNETIKSFVSFSPDGSKIAYSAGNYDEGFNIYIMDIKSRTIEHVIDNLKFDDLASFSPDGSKIVFISHAEDGLQSDIYTAKIDGSEVTQITHTSDRDEIFPSFTPDGRYIVYSAGIVNAQPDDEMHIFIKDIMDPSDPAPTQLTTGRYFNIAPRINSKGDKIVFNSYREDSNDNHRFQVIIMNINGTQQMSLSEGIFSHDFFPGFSPDDSKIAFVSVSPVSVYNLNVMNIDGTDRQVHPGITNTIYHFAWGKQADSDHDGIGDACENEPPSISAESVTVMGGTSSSFRVATVSDANQNLDTLQVTVDGGTSATRNGVTISGISINESGEVEANVSASCSATAATFTLRVTDDGNLFAEAPLIVSVTPNPPPVLGYDNPPPILVGGMGVISPSIGPSDDGGLPSITLQSLTPSSGLSLSVDGSNGNINVTEATKAGTYTAVIRASDQCQSTDASVVIQVICPPITLSDLPNAEVDSDYNQTVVPSFEGSYTFTIATGKLPDGLSLNPSTGVISGRPSRAGTYPFTIKARHTSGCEATRSYQIVISCPTVTLSDLPDGEAGMYYNQTVVPSKAGSYSFSLLLGSLPPGFSLNPTTGIIVGLTHVPGTYQFTIKASLANGCAATRSYQIVISCPTITLSDLPPFALNASYNHKVTAEPATGTYLLELIDGSLPAGLVFNPATGVISGKPTKTGPYSFTIRATGFSSCSTIKVYSGEITASCPAITLSALPNGTVGKVFSAKITASPAGSYSYELVSGSLPPGVNFYSSTGMLYGYPSLAGEYKFSIRATDVNGCSKLEDYTLTINGN